MQVKMFYGRDMADLQREMNNWLRGNTIGSRDIVQIFQSESEGTIIITIFYEQ